MGFIMMSKLKDVGSRGVEEIKNPANRILCAVVVLLSSSCSLLSTVSGIFLVYLMVGAGILVGIEGPVEDQKVLTLRRDMSDFLENNECLSCAVLFNFLEEDRSELRSHNLLATYNSFLANNTCVDAEEFEAILRKVVEATSRGVSPLYNVSHESVWTFGQSFFFAGTLISTVGYGHVSPATQGGKLFTIIYAIFGIPLTLTLLTALADRLRIPSMWFLGKLNTRLGHLWQPMQIRLFHLIIIGVMLLVFMFLIPAAIFQSIEEKWTYLDAFYYCFISLTTIGLGDYIPGDHPNQSNRGFYKVLSTVYLLIGLCCMMLLLATMYDIPFLNLTRYVLRRPLRDDGDEELQPITKIPSGPKYDRQLDSPESPSPGQGHPPEPYYQSDNQALR